jgi:hypothetical protein
MEASSLLEQASAAAKRHVQGWIRAALREVALQALRWHVEHGGTEEETRVVITGDAVAACQQFCRTVGAKWAEKLRLGNRDGAAEWVDEIVASETDCLFFNAPSTDDSAEIEQEGTEGTTEPLGNNNSIEESLDTHDTTLGERTDGVESKRISPLTTWAKLKRIGEHDILSENQELTTIEDAILYLDKLGENNETFWSPNQWPAIQQAAALIPQRLHGMTVTERRPDETAELLLSNGSAPAADGASENRTDALQLLLDRKRKSSHKKRHNKPRGDKAPRIQHAPEMLFDDTPRPPSRLPSSMQISRDEIMNHWTKTEKKQLDQMLHSAGPVATNDDAVGNSATPSLMLGALRNIGRFQYFNQLSADSSPTESAASRHGAVNDDDRHRRRQQKDAALARLGDHVPVREASNGNSSRSSSEAKKSRVTWVARTVQPHDRTAPERGGRCWFDFDLGHCTMEGIGPDGRRTLYSFRSVEVMLLDEDPPDNSTGATMEPAFSARA